MQLRTSQISAVALATVMLVGCTQSQILITLEASVAATEALIATLEVTGKISPATAGAIETAITGLPAAYAETAAELSSTDNAALKAAKIAALYGDTLTALKALPPEAQFYAAAITASIHAFLNALSTGAKMLATSKEPLGTTPTMSTRHLQNIETKAAILQMKLLKLKLQR
jgi:hypothetical protein